MNTKFLKIVSMFAVISILALSLMAFTMPGELNIDPVELKGGPGGGRGNPGQGGGPAAPGNPGRGGGSVVPGTPLSDAEKDALNQAILEEYGALNLYQSVIGRFGSVYPFEMIARSEQQHVDALTRQATKYGVVVPANPGLTAAASFSSLSEACQAGVNAEIADAALYDQLKPVVSHSDILQVFNNLQSASLNSHLPVFQTCQ